MTFFDPDFVLPDGITQKDLESLSSPQCYCKEDLIAAEKYIQELEATIRDLRDKAITNK